MNQITIDVAGAATGGAARYRAELLAYVKDGERDSELRPLGRDRRITPKWLARRETIGRFSDHRIAANNFAYAIPGGPRTVVLRNPLHFMSDSRSVNIPGAPDNIDSQSTLVRALAKRCPRVVVPSQGMARRVLSVVPELSAAVTVRFHPLTIPDLDLSTVDHVMGDRPFALLTGLPSVHKDLRTPAERMANLLRRVDAETVLAMTCTEEELGWTDSRIVFLGRLSLVDVLAYTARSRFSFLPTTVESFGYPLAEARAIGVPIVTPQQAETLDVAGDAAVTYDDTSDESLENAVRLSLSSVVTPEPEVFDRDRYFDWLTKV